MTTVTAEVVDSVEDSAVATEAAATVAAATAAADTEAATAAVSLNIYTEDLPTI